MVYLAGFLFAKMITGQNCLGASNDIRTPVNKTEAMMNDGVYDFEHCSFESPMYYAPIVYGKQFDALYVKKCEIPDRLSGKVETILK